MKKIIALVLAAAAVAAFFSGCGGKSEYVGEVNVYNWGEYIDTSVIDDFEAQTHIKVNYTTYASNEVLYSNLKTGAASYDVIIPSDYMVSRLINEDMLEKLDFSNIPNYSLLGDDYKNLEYDPDGLYSVAYMWGTVGLIYNTELVDEEITSWSALFDEKYAGQILMFDNSRDALGIALVYLGYSQNTTNEAELNEAYELLRQQKPFVQAYVMDQIFDKLETGEAAIGPYYAGDYLLMLETNENLAFVRPTEGTNAFVDAMCVPKGAENKANAEAFINFMCSTDVALANMNEIYYATPNAEAIAAFSEELDELSREVMFPSGEELAGYEVFINLPQDTLNLYDTLWANLKA